MGKGQSLQQTVLEIKDIHAQKNGVGALHYIQKKKKLTQNGPDT